MKIALLFLCLISYQVCITASQLHSFSPKQPQELRFSENKGQWNQDIAFCADFPYGKMLLEKNSFFFTLLSPSDLSKIHHPGTKNGAIVNGHSFRETFVGTKPAPVIAGDNAFSDYENYYIGNDPTHWASGVKIFQKVKYHDLYDGIDLAVTGRGEANIKYDFIVKKGADASQIKIQYEGVDKLELSKNKLLIKTSVGNLIEEKPFAYQDINNTRIEVKCRFVISNNQLTFDFPNDYNKNFPLVIDPSIIFSTYTGAVADNWGYTATYDNDGNMYLAGLVDARNPFNGSTSAYYTTVGAFQSVWGGGNSSDGIAYPCDMGVSKFSSDGSTLLYRTYIGGSNNETPNSMVVDPQNNLIIYGVSYSSNFPVTANAYDGSYNGGGDMVVLKLNATGTALLGSTFIGGSASDGINYDPGEDIGGNLKKNYGDQNRGEVNIDANGDIYVASCTMSSNFPVTPGVIQSTFGGTQDGCVFKLKSDCSQLLWATYLGGSNDDACYSLDIGAAGSIYVAGGTMSSNFPTTAGTLHPGYLGGTYDGFVAHINGTGTQLIKSTYIGTSGDDQVYCVKLDGEKNVYFMGQTTGGYPVHNAAFSNPNSGQFISKVTPGLDSVFYSTVFGNGNGKPNISPTAFLVDTCQNVYVAGWGTSNSLFTQLSAVFENDMHNMPLTGDAFQSSTDGTDFYFFVLSKNAQSMLYGSYFGGDGYIDHVDGGTSRFDKRGIIYEAICAGCTGYSGVSNSLTPTTTGAWSQTNDSWNCNELGLKIAFNLSAINLDVNAYPRATGCVPLTVQFQGNVSNVQSVEWYFDDGDSSSLLNPIHTFIDTGLFNVMLVGYNPNACITRDTAYVSVNVGDDSLVATFQPYMVNKCDSFFVHLNSAYYPGANYLWNAGDGNIYTADSLVHYYNTPGQYNVSLIIKDSSRCNLVDTFTTQLIVPKNSASFTLSDSGGCAPASIQFNAPVSLNAIFLWSFGDGSSGSNISNPIHTFDTAGIYNVSLKVIDTTCGHIDSASELITVSSIHLNIDVGPRASGCIPLTVQFQDSGSNVTSVEWNFADGNSSVNQNPTHTFTNTGVYNVMFIGYNNAICNTSDTTFITVVAGNDSVIAAFQSHLLNKCDSFFLKLNSVASAGATYLWNTGDGNNYTTDSLIHYYNTPGQYNITLVATDSNRCNISDTLMMQLTIPVNLASFTLSDTEGCAPLFVQFTSPPTTSTIFSWTFGDGSAGSNIADPSHTYNAAGIYNAHLKVIDTACNQVDTAVSVINVYQPPLADFILANDSFPYQTPVTFTSTSTYYSHLFWNLSDTTITDETDPVYAFQSLGIKTICLTASNNFCIDTLCKNIDIFFTALIGVPNAFSPNGDGVNDIVRVEGKGIIEIR